MLHVEVFEEGVHQDLIHVAIGAKALVAVFLEHLNKVLTDFKHTYLINEVLGLWAHLYAVLGLLRPADG